MMIVRHQEENAEKLFKIAMSCVVLAGMVAPITNSLLHKNQVLRLQRMRETSTGGRQPKGDRQTSNRRSFQEYLIMVDPASLSKLMTIFMAYDAIKSGKEAGG